MANAWIATWLASANSRQVRSGIRPPAFLPPRQYVQKLRGACRPKTMFKHPTVLATPQIPSHRRTMQRPHNLSPPPFMTVRQRLAETLTMAI
jgi:hypothetical protein